MVRRAKVRDVPQMARLINAYAQKGQMLGRPMIELYESIRTFAVVERDDKIVGCGSLAVIWNDIAEVRAVAVDADYRGQGIGRAIVEALLDDAKELEIPRLFCLTYQPGFFKKLGFKDLDKHDLPHKVWKDCINCPKFPDCDEIALILHFDAAHT
ncbi:N-acetyltransferase [candidate division KSB1 bacterium]|nr:N-acetyltransferase [candidate division KSB1 bacterium]